MLLAGSTFMGYSTYFYQQAGLPTTSAFDMSSKYLVEIHPKEEHMSNIYQWPNTLSEW